MTASQKHRPASRPTTAISPDDFNVSQFLPKLLEAIEAEGQYPQDKLQAQVCLGWLCWTVGDYDQASSHLPLNLSEEIAQIDQPESISEWTKVCVLKASYLSANCLSRSEKRVQALAVFEAALSSIAILESGQKARKQLRFWTELFLTEFCMLQAKALERGETSLEDDNSLASFRAWAKYWETSNDQGTPVVGGYGFRGAVPRRRVWNEYYSAISGILQHDLPFPTGHIGTVPNDASARNQLRMELKKVEAAYEGLLLTEISFPRAEEERQEVENFVAVMMRNWNILSNRDWLEQDLGPGGKEGLSRGVLDILYRAATKTFHSTAILRYLFTVHLSVAEFDLAFHAFDSYFNIVKKGKARVDKTGSLEPNLDDDSTVLETISQATTALCKYGFQNAAEKAYELSVELEEMIKKLPAPLSNTDNYISTVEEEENGDGAILHPRVSSRVNALAWQSIGLAQANWSRATYDASIRTELQTRAIRSFQKSLSPESGNPTDVRTLFTLGLLLAEQRELSPAIEIVKAALMSNKKSSDHTLDPGSYWKERSLIPLWHLLALLLSARQDFVMAARACEGAFEQFDDPTVLFGSQSLEGTYRSDHLNEVESDAQPKGLVDEMDDIEKEGILEVKMTQLALLEVLEGPEVAVNASHELLVLYTRLFGTLRPKGHAAQKSLDVPKSSAGTLRSFRGSIFGNKSDKNPRALRQASTMEAEGGTELPERPKTAQTASSVPAAGPTIQVTKENGDRRSSQHSRRSSSTRGRRSESQRRNSLKKQPSSSGNRRRAVSTGAVPQGGATLIDGETCFAPDADAAAHDRPDFFAPSRKSSVSSQQSFSRGRGLFRFDTTATSIGGAAMGPDNLLGNSLSQTNPLPVIQFPKEQVKRQRQTILVKVWLMIAVFYRRAKLHRDAKGAIQEAKKIVDELDAGIGKDPSSPITTSNPGWGGKRCVDELWGDVRTEVSNVTCPLYM